MLYQINLILLYKLSIKRKKYKGKDIILYEIDNNKDTFLSYLLV